MKMFLTIVTAIGIATTGTVARATDTILWIDDDTGHIGQVDVTTQSVVAGSVVTVTSPGFNLTGGLSDIGFTSSGTLYGSTFTNLFSINTSTGVSTNLGSFGSGTPINALVGDGAQLLGAGYATTSVYAINPSNPGALTVYAPTPAVSAGDLAFAGTSLYESGVSQANFDELVDVTTNSVVGLFHVGTTTGTELDNVLGLADDGTTLYAVDNTEIYSVDAANGVLTPLFNYGGAGLSDARGAAFPNEAVIAPPAVPEPSPLALACVGLAAVGALSRRKRR